MVRRLCACPSGGPFESDEEAPALSEYVDGLQEFVRTCDRLGLLPEIEKRAAAREAAADPATLRAEKVSRAGGAGGHLQTWRQDGCSLVDKAQQASRRLCWVDAFGGVIDVDDFGLHRAVIRQVPHMFGPLEGARSCHDASSLQLHLWFSSYCQSCPLPRAQKVDAYEQVKSKLLLSRTCWRSYSLAALLVRIILCPCLN